jgi:hypothetical protein
VRVYDKLTGNPGTVELESSGVLEKARAVLFSIGEVACVATAIGPCELPPAMKLVGLEGSLVLTPVSPCVRTITL